MDERTGLFGRDLPTLDRAIEIGVADGRLLSVSFPHAIDNGETHPLLDRIERVFDGESETFDDVELALTVPTDRRHVLDALRRVPRGASITTAELAGMTAGLDPSDDESLRTVQTALRENPVPVVVPDHRVTDGPDATPSTVASVLRRVEGI